MAETTTQTKQVEVFDASNGARIFRLPLEVFPAYMGYAHLVQHGDRLTLVDVGSGYGNSHADLLAGLEQVREAHGVDARLDRIDRIIITHGHIDHFGGLMRVKEAAPQAEVGLHRLAKPVLVSYDERVLVTRTAVEDFLRRAGVPPERLPGLLEMYMLGKREFKPVPVDFTFGDGDVIDDTFRVIHVPGHAPGLVMLLVGDVLLTADHVLPHTSVALAPESIMPYTGIGHYIESLEKALAVEGVRLALGGHEEPVEDYYGMVRRTLDGARGRVELVYEHCDEPRTIYEIALRIYDSLDGYSELLKVEQTGARVEYLHQRGRLAIDNLDSLEEEHSPPLRFRQV
ncbi:MAG TPA: MBL fold metallo-hydrolase [Aggregatilineales bacterium]|nr:MBL fold metallo-hydrolase [Chloroflexota bacterium]HOA23383.1 MBL fold metallo-hydrolase [Aggregatilineales bacterium]HPV07031.1 MBL fold metallo-hydrolase [Aggregatilineales bacterium]HQA69863.1 MBL fold metallo-hydrolase [Aggregatilineales bacterium]HQE18574.1 MBL fold metallo-hydrolase [Aggregatilineales bacterium]